MAHSLLFPPSNPWGAPSFRVLCERVGRTECDIHHRLRPAPGVTIPVCRTVSNASTAVTICTSSFAAAIAAAPCSAAPPRRDLFVRILEQVRQRHRFVVVGYVVMPEHFHLLISEPQDTTPSVVMQVLKQRFAQQMLQAWRKAEKAGQARLWPQAGEIWQRRFYDFNVWTERKRVEKLRYMHRNPVKRGLVTQPDQWPRSSFRACAFGETGPVRINDTSVLQMKIRAPAA